MGRAGHAEGQAVSDDKPRVPRPPGKVYETKLYVPPEPAEDVLARLEAVVAQLTGPGVQIIQTPTPVPPSSGSLLPPPPEGVVPVPRPSMPARAAKQTSRVVRWIGVVIAVLTGIAQLISTFSRPENGPLVQTLIVIAAGLKGKPAPAPSELPEPIWAPPGQ
jgi:hypothetical protein